LKIFHNLDLQNVHALNFTKTVESYLVTVAYELT